MKRRSFITGSTYTFMGLRLFKDGISELSKIETGTDEIRDFLRKILYTRNEIDDWFAGRAFPFTRHHGELGWLLNNNSYQDGINKSWSVYTYERDDGERLKIEEFARINNKKVLYNLSYPSAYIARHASEGYRWDQPFKDFLTKHNLPFIDLSLTHLNEFKQYGIKIEDYLSKYFIGHYGPAGNFFCAHSIRDKMIDMLIPKPVSYTVRD